MKLYHVSFNNSEYEKIFIPRVPNDRAGTENSTIKRISFSESIEGCLSAIPRLSDRLIQSDGIITLYTLDTDKVDNNYLKNYNEVYNYVDDALITKEWWYLLSITLIGEQYKINNIEFDNHFIVHEYQRFKIMEWLEERGFNFRHIKDLDYLVNNLLYEINYRDENGVYIDLPAKLMDYVSKCHCNIITPYDLKLEKIK